MGSTHRRRHGTDGPRRSLAALLCAAALPVPAAAGCSAVGGGPDGPGEAAPASLAELAEKTGCTPTGERAVEDLEQGNCETPRGRYVLLSFTTDEGMRTWLDEARPWGGSYLVGARWVAVSTPETLQSLRADLGGKIVSGDPHGGTHG